MVGLGELGRLHPAVDLHQVLDVGHDLVQLVWNAKQGLKYNVQANMHGFFMRWRQDIKMNDTLFWMPSSSGRIISIIPQIPGQDNYQGNLVDEAFGLAALSEGL